MPGGVAEPELIAGVDFSGARAAVRQRQKTIAIVATRLDPGSYRVTPEGMNARLLERPLQPGWSADELAAALIAEPGLRVAGFDCPFSIPKELLDSASFARAVGRRAPFRSWQAFNEFVAGALPLRPP